MRNCRLFVVVVALTAAAASNGEVLKASDDHYVLRHEATDQRSVDELWLRLINPASWWHPEHTYSGDAGNLSLDLRAGGLWLETWDGGSIAHGEVLLVESGRVLRMNAPFGPLQEAGAYVTWTITISEDGGGSRVVFDEVANAGPGAGLDELAMAVDFVKTETIRRLVSE